MLYTSWHSASLSPGKRYVSRKVRWADEWRSHFSILGTSSIYRMLSTRSYSTRRNLVAYSSSLKGGRSSLSTYKGYHMKPSPPLRLDEKVFIPIQYHYLRPTERILSLDRLATPLICSRTSVNIAFPLLQASECQ